MVSIGPQIRVGGESNFRMALRRVYSEVNTLKNEMDLLTNSFKKNDSALEKNRKMSEMLTRQIETQKSAVDATRTTYDRTIQKFNDSIAAYEKQRAKTEELNKAYDQSKEKVNTLTSLYGKNSEQVKQAKEEQKALKDELSQSEKEQQKLNDEVFRSAYVMEDWKGRVAQNEAQLEKYRRELEKLPNSLQVIGDELKKSGEKMVNWGTNLTKYVSAPLAALGTYSVKNAASFEDGMAKIYTIATESQKPMEQMREELIQLSNDTGYSLDDLAEAAYQAVSASVDATKATEFLGDATKLARAGFTSTTQSVDLLTTVMNSYGLGTEKAAYISDVLLKTQNDGKTVIDELAHSMGTVIPTASNYNVSLEQLAAAYATMTKQGVDTARGTTFLNAMFTELEKESSDISQILMNETGKSFAQLMGEGKSLADVLEILYDSVGQDNEQFQRLFGNVRSGRAAASLVADDFSVLRDEIDKMGKATGQTAYALEVLNTPALQAKKALNKLKNTTVDLGETFIQDMLPIFEDVVAGIGDFVKWFHELDDGTKKMIVRLGAFAAVAGPLLTFTGKAVIGIGNLTKGIGTLTKNLATGATSFSNWLVGLGSAGEAIATSMPLIAGLGIAYVGVGVAAQTMIENEREQIRLRYGLSETMQDNIQKVNDLSEAYAASKQTLAENLNATDSQVLTAKSLVEQYNALVDETGLVSEENQIMADIIIGQLAEALGIQKSEVRELIEENGKFGKSIEQVIANLEIQAKTAALTSYLTETTKKQIEAERNLEAITKDVEFQQRIANHTQREADAAIEAYNQHAGDTPEVMQNYATAMDRAVEKNSQAQTALENLKEAEKKAQDGAAELQRDYDYYMGKLKDITEESMDNVASEIEDGKQDVVNAADGVAQSALSALTIDATDKGKNYVQGFINGINAMMGKVQSVVAGLGGHLSGTFNKSLGEHSPSKITFQSGQYFDEGFINGVKSKLSETEAMVSRLGKSSVNTFNTYIPEPSTVSNSRTVSAPISVNVNVNGNVDDVNALADVVAERINDAIRREAEVFA